MNWESLGAMAELVAALATLATLIYLARQLKANTRATQATNWHEITRDYMRHGENMQDAMIGSAWGRGLADPSQLSEDDARRFGAMMSNHALSVQAIFAQYQNGQIPEETYRAYAAYFCSIIAQPGGRQWWEITGRSVFVPSMVVAIDEQFARGDHDTLPSPDFANQMIEPANR